MTVIQRIRVRHVLKGSINVPTGAPHTCTPPPASNFQGDAREPVHRAQGVRTERKVVPPHSIWGSVPVQPSCASLETLKTSGWGDRGCFAKVEESSSPNHLLISTCRCTSPHAPSQRQLHKVGFHAYHSLPRLFLMAPPHHTAAPSTTKRTTFEQNDFAWEKNVNKEQYF